MSAPQKNRDVEDREDVARRATTNLALLIRLAQAESLVDRGGTSIELEHDAWYAIETLLISTRRDVELLEGEEKGAA